MSEFDALIDIAETLLGPNGCPWDKEQTLKTLRPSVLEEACELIEAIDFDDKDKITEELGDCLFVVIMLSKIAEKEGLFHFDEAVKKIREKIIRRHPHIFGEEKGTIKDSEQVIERWEQIKSQEKGHEDRKSALDGIPKGLPSLARAQKMIKRLKKKAYPLKEGMQARPFSNEKELGEQLIDIVIQAQGKGIDAEHALRKALSELESDFRKWEGK